MLACPGREPVEISPFGGNWTCADPPQLWQTVGMNTHLAPMYYIDWEQLTGVRTFTELEAPSERFLLIDAPFYLVQDDNYYAPIYRHLGTANLGYADGHIDWREEQIETAGTIPPW